MSQTETTPTKRSPSFPSLLLRASAVALLSVAVAGAQQQKKNKKDAPSTAAATTTAAQAPKLARTTTRHEVRRFGYGGALTILGAPAGSITIEAWPRSEVDITADIELRADTEEDLTRLAAVNTFLLDEDTNHLRILSVGTHDRATMKRVAKGFPKQLLGLPWKIDYRIRVPAITDIEIDAGRGPITLKGVEGAIRLTALEGDMTLNPAGGLLTATVGAGHVNITLASRNWRGAGADIRLATGDLTLELPAGYSGDINADILRTGRIENQYPTLEPCERTTFTPRSIKGRAGAGGPQLSLTVGDGILRIKKSPANE
ncbi:MAG TPA: hypothetical protein VF553_21740 [Pyrinomonadaceae bacterium]|jgi:hypothetical protein